MTGKEQTLHYHPCAGYRSAGILGNTIEEKTRTILGWNEPSDQGGYYGPEKGKKRKVYSSTQPYQYDINCRRKSSSSSVNSTTNEFSSLFLTNELTPPPSPIVRRHSGLPQPPPYVQSVTLNGHVTINGHHAAMSSNQTLSNGHQAPPSGHQTLPSGHQTLPSGHQTLPSGHQILPSGHQALPGGYQGIPCGNQRTVKGHQQFPAGYHQSFNGHQMTAGHQVITVGPVHAHQAMSSGHHTIPTGHQPLSNGPATHINDSYHIPTPEMGLPISPVSPPSCANISTEDESRTNSYRPGFSATEIFDRLRAQMPRVSNEQSKFRLLLQTIGNVIELETKLAQLNEETRSLSNILHEKRMQHLQQPAPASYVNGPPVSDAFGPSVTAQEQEDVPDDLQEIDVTAFRWMVSENRSIDQPASWNAYYGQNRYESQQGDYAVTVDPVTVDTVS